ncbi:MAG TPA: hypothetical protein VE528_01880, partial [Thermoleophilaceae bacterium]|nr:hypothetical protein [Thermoleophilaceae bacterium]
PVAGEEPDVVTSDAPDASARIARFAAGTGTWLVSVLMVSEGVDVPRLRVGVYATSARTELFFRQVVGRFIRRTPAPADQMSHVFLPADAALKRLAAQIEEERRHAIRLEPGGEALAEVPERVRSEPGDAFRALSSSARGEAETLFTTQPGETMSLFAADPSPALAAFTAPGPAVATPSRPASETPHERRERLREERRGLVSALSRLTGEPHKVIHARINRETGAASVTAASAGQLERGNAMLERETTRGR